MSVKNKNLFILSILAVFTLVIAACAPAQPGAATTGGTDSDSSSTDSAAADTSDADSGDGETLTILYWQAASLPGPYLSGGTKDQDAGAITLEPLANTNPDGELVPKLATEIPTVENGGVAEDLMSVTWSLKDGVLWSDGSPFTSEDVVFTWEYCTNPETGCSSLTSFDGITSVEAVDELTVKVTFENPTPYPYTAFADAQTPIIQKAQFQDCVGSAAQQCTEQNTKPHGTGPYRVVDFKVNDVVVYERNPHYHGDTPFFSEVIFKGGGDAASAARAVLETGEADYAWNLQVEAPILVEMESAGIGTIVTSFAGNVERILVNQTNPDPNLGDKRSEWTAEDPNSHPFLVGTVVPQALSMAIDRSVIAEQLYGFAGQPTCNVIPGPTAYVSTANDSCLTQDIDGANALLDEAGIVDTDGDGIREYEGMPLSITYQTSTNSVRQKTQALIKQWWGEIGVETELINHDAAVFFGGDPNSPDTYGKFYTDVEMYTTGPNIDPQLHLANWQCSEVANASNNWLGNNVFRGCNAEYDELFAELTTTPVGERRYEIAKQLNDINVQNYYQIPLVHRGSVSAHANSLQGVWMNGGWDTEMWNIAEWTRE